MSINARCDEKRRRKDLDMLPRRHSIKIYNIEDSVEDAFAPAARRVKSSTYKVVPSDYEVEERCELIKSTYDVISKYTRAMFDKNETVV